VYIPPHFAEHRTEEIQRIITSHPLGVLVVNGRRARRQPHSRSIRSTPQPARMAVCWRTSRAGIPYGKTARMGMTSW